MKISKRILGVLTSAVCTVSLCAVTMTFNASAADVVKSDWADQIHYTAYEDHVVIDDCMADATSVTINEEILGIPVTEIASEAFEACSDLASVSILADITSIGDDAFRDCTSLQSITIPETVTSVGAYAFNNTEIVNVQATDVKYVSNWVVGCNSATAVEIKSGITGIADKAFYGCGLETVTIPETVKTIGNSAFANNAFRKVTITAGVEILGNMAFQNCENLLTVSLPSTLKTIGDAAFKNCTLLDNVSIPGSVTEVGFAAFDGTQQYVKQAGPAIYIGTWVVNCDNSENTAITIKTGTKGIADGAFMDKTFVKSVTIPEGVVAIGDYAFEGCENISQLSLPNSLTSIGEGAFAGTWISTITLKVNVANVGAYAFSGCTNLTDVYVNNASCKLGNYFVSNSVTLYGVANSTTEAYAKKYDNVFKTIANVVNGDVDSNGEINLYDIIKICKHLLGEELTIEEKAAADYNGDSIVNIYDAIALATKILNEK